MRKLAPILTMVVVVAGFWLALREVPLDQRGGPRRSAAKPTLDAASRPAPPASRPESRARGITATPFAESAPAPESRAETRAESRPESLPYREVVVVEVVRENGRPIDGAALEARFGEVRLTAFSDASGHAEFEAHRGVSAEVEVWGQTFCPHVERLPLDPARVRLVVPNGARVAGRVNVSGQPPSEPIAIDLTATSATSCSKTRIDGGADHQTRTDEAGRFEFFNLPPTWQGELRLADAYMLANAGPPIPSAGWLGWPGRIYHLTAPNDALDIALIEQISIKGRITGKGGRDPVQGWVLAKLVRGEERDIQQTLADLQGRFRVWVSQDTALATLEISDASGLGTKTIDVPGPFDTVRDLGRIELDAVRQIAFRVRDAAGAPIAGAIATLTDTFSWSDPTDDEGKSSIEIDRAHRELRVGKLGWATKVVTILPDATDPIEVQLAAGNQIVVEVTLPDGSVPAQGLVLVRLVSESKMFASPDGMADEIFERTGASEDEQESTGEKESTLTAALDGDGRAILAGFQPGVQFALQIRGRAIDELVDERFVSLGATETKVVKVRLQSMPQTFVGRVRSEEGNPVDGAVIIIRATDTGPTSTAAESGAEGRFEMRGIFALSVDLRIEKEGFVPFRLPDVPVPPPGAERDFIVTRARDLVVELVTDQGRRMTEDAEVVVVVPGASSSPYQPEALGDGVYKFWSLPPGPVDIHVVVGITKVFVPHDSRRAAVRVVIPTEGAANLFLRRDPGDPEHLRLRVLPRAGRVAWESEVPADAGDHEVHVKLLPGEYWAALEGYDSEAGDWVALGTTHVFEVAAHHATDVEIVR